VIDAASAEALRRSRPEVIAAGTHVMDVLGRPVRPAPPAAPPWTWPGSARA
jgi:hypothetical protein